MKFLACSVQVQMVIMILTTFLTTRTTSFVHHVVRGTSTTRTVSIPSSLAAVSSSEEPFLSSPAMQSLLDGALNRATRTLKQQQQYDSPIPEEKGPQTTGNSAGISELLASMNTTNQTTRNQDNYYQRQRQHQNGITQDLLTSVMDRSKRTLTTTTKKRDGEASTLSSSTTDNNDILPTKDLRYHQNPAVSLTALAHWLWSSTLRPHDDFVIDATCGNGKDAVGIASILFGNDHLFLEQQAQLLCIDVQEQACQKTQMALSQVLGPSIMTRHVQILHASHAPLPSITNNNQEPGLVVYNLGYLPGSSNNNNNNNNNTTNNKPVVQTRVESTLASITDALLMIRIGGMVSIMTYPGSNRQEDMAVRKLLQAVVAMTNNKKQTTGPSWQDVVKDKDKDNDNQYPQEEEEEEEETRLQDNENHINENDPTRTTSTISSKNNGEYKTLLLQQLSRIASAYETQGGVRRTFRVTEHKKIGLDNAPILMTATRIK
jgi:Putative rRNA methylase